MNKGILGILVGLLGAALFWLFRAGKLAGGGAVYEREIKLKVKNGECGIEAEPEPVTLSRGGGDKVRWSIINPESEDGTPCHRQVKVCVGRWTLNGSNVEPPVDDLDNGQYCRTVKPGQTKRLPARAKSRAPEGDYYYQVLIDGEIAIDPIVRIVV